MSKRHLLTVLLLVATVAVALPNEITSAGYINIKDSKCWDCHTGDDVPLREFIEVDGAETIVALQEQFAYEVRVDNAWVAEIVRLEGGLNIANAPSLAFSSVQPPDLGDLVEGVIPAVDFTDTENLTVPTDIRSDLVVGFVDAGVTDLKITVTPENTDPVVGPQLDAWIYPGRTTAGNQPEFRIESPGAGQSASLHLTSGAEVADAGFGSWAIEVRSAPSASPTNLLADTKFTVTFDKYYNVTGENVQFLSKTVSLDAGQSTAFGWILVAQDTPGSGEYVTVNMNTTTYYLHDAHESSEYPDYSYTNREFRFNVVPEGNDVKFEGSPQTGTMQNLELGVTVTRISEAIGYVSAFLLIASIYTGGMFGKATRRQQNKWFGSAKRRVAFHNFISYGIILAAVIHLILFVSPWENSFHWTNGLIWGGIGILAMLALGVTGAIQVPMIRKWNYSVWRWTHFGLAIAAIVFTIIHMFLDGANLAPMQDFVEWKDPFDPRI